MGRLSSYLVASFNDNIDVIVLPGVIVACYVLFWFMSVGDLLTSEGMQRE